MGNQPRNRIKIFEPHDYDAPLSKASDFANFYERTYLPVFRYLYGLTGGPQEDVEDLTAETFVRAWHARRSFRGDGQASLGWVMKIARNLVIDDSRRRRVRPVEENNISTQFADIKDEPEEMVVKGEEQDLLWMLLQTLPEEGREMLVLRYMLGWRVQQIAAYLETLDNTVSVTIRRMLERLRQQWPQS